MTLSEKIGAALARLDPADDSQWMADGTPRTAAVQQLAGDRSISRVAIASAFPDFRRAVASMEAEADAPALAPVPLDMIEAAMAEQVPASETQENFDPPRANGSELPHDGTADATPSLDSASPFDSRGRFVGYSPADVATMPPDVRAVYDALAESATIASEWEAEAKAATAALTQAVKEHRNAKATMDTICKPLSTVACARLAIEAQRQQ